MKIDNLLIVLAAGCVVAAGGLFINDRWGSSRDLPDSVQISFKPPEQVTFAQQQPLLIQLKNTNATDIRVCGMNWC